VGVGVTAFDSTGIYPFNSNRVSEYLFSIPDTGESTTYMETAPPNMVLVCETFYLSTLISKCIT
jgi:hypothetical protein